ncbi:hypothetical protein AURDEDRAFT_145406 [Auricularia subglabra TFB-10046 SS5]|nr:hypothetical protein AURDEDRAFT_145406 [Auricularia subglabra TFB-10046 SS5]
MFGDSSPSPTRYAPQHSSPLAHASSSPLAVVQAKRSGQYKSRTSSATRRASGGLGATPEATEKSLMRERLLAKCEEQRKRDRERARARSWASSSDGEMSSDGPDVAMDVGWDDEEDEADTEIFVERIMAAEQRRSRHRMNLSFDYEVGSSPGVPEDELEEYFNTEELPDEDEEFKALYERYMEETQGLHTVEEELGGPDSQMSDDFIAPPQTPQNKGRRYARPVPVPRISDILSQCPGCNLPWTVQDLPAARHTCPRCHMTLPPEAVSHAWHSDHGHEFASKHRLLATALPDGAILVCGAEGCDWCFDL